MDLTGTDGQNVGSATFKLSQSVRLQEAAKRLSCVKPLMPTCPRVLDAVVTVLSTAIKRKTSVLYLGSIVPLCWSITVFASFFLGLLKFNWCQMCKNCS